MAYPFELTKAFGGQLRRYEHESSSTGTKMKFTVFVPPGASSDNQARPIYYLSGVSE